MSNKNISPPKGNYRNFEEDATIQTQNMPTIGNTKGGMTNNFGTGCSFY